MNMKPGDKVVPAGHPIDSKQGTVKLISGNKVVVTWVMGSGWPWTVPHDMKELEVVQS